MPVTAVVSTAEFVDVTYLIRGVAWSENYHLILKILSWCVRVCVCVCARARVIVRVHTYGSVCVRVCASAHVSSAACVCVCERERERQRQRETDRQMHARRKTHTHTPVPTRIQRQFADNRTHRKAEIIAHRHTYKLSFIRAQPQDNSYRAEQPMPKKDKTGHH